MRYMETAKAAKLTNAGYTWDIAYPLILEREAYESSIVSAAQSAVTISEHDTNYTETILYYILPRLFSNILILDGVSWGNIRFYIGWNDTASGSAYSSYIHAHITVLARTAAGVDRTLATSDTGELIKAYPGGTTSGEVTEDFPLRIIFDNQKLLGSERLLLKITYHARYGTSSGTKTITAGQYHTVNTNNLYIQIPIAGEQ